MKKLSTPQVAFMMRMAELGTADYDPYPFGAGRMSKIWASAWHRTCDVLHRAGLVERFRVGDHYAARLTPAGRDWLFANGAA